MKIQIKILNKEFFIRHKLGGDYYDIPMYETFGAAAMDLHCTEDVTIYPGEVKQIKTGLAIWVGSDLQSQSLQWKQDMGVAGLIVPRSGLGSKGLVLANTIGLIDSDYQGELLVNVWNRNDNLLKEDWYGWPDADKKCLRVKKIELKAGDRFAQIMFVPIIKAQWEVVEDFNNNTQRGAMGFGSTGN